MHAEQNLRALEKRVAGISRQITLRFLGLGETDRHETQVTLAAREKIRVCGQKFFTPISQGGEQEEIEIAFGTGLRRGAFQHRMITERQVKTAEPNARRKRPRLTD